MENCSESSFILFEKTSPVESPLWTERPGGVPARRLDVRLAMVTNPLKRIFIRFLKMWSRHPKNASGPPSDKQTSRFRFRTNLVRHHTR